MNNQTIILVSITLLLGAVIGYLVATDNIRATDDYSKVPAGMHRMADGTMMNNGGMGMMDHSMMTVASEREFITEMIPHHQEAVDTAKEVLARGATTPELKTLLENVITAQEAEIENMKNWYQTWYSEPYTPSGKYEPMMRELENLSGSALDRAWLEDMIMHHMGAIMMARSVEPHIEHEEIRNLSQAIISSQSQEIELMQNLLRKI